eukprot:3010603-Lingulodinium_polyedra.AAC.1
MINGPDCSHLASSGHRWKAAEALAEWQQEYGPDTEFAPLNGDGVWQDRAASDAGSSQPRRAEEQDIPGLIPPHRGPPTMFEIR